MRALNTPLYRYGGTIVIVLAAAAVRLSFLHGMGTRAAFLTFYPAVMLASLYGGWQTGLLATALSACLADMFWISPGGSLWINNPDDWLSLAIFVLSCTMIAAITDAMQRAHTRVRHAEAEAQFAVEQYRLQMVLRETDEQRRLALESANLGTWYFDPSSRRVFWDKRCRAIFGITAEETVEPRATLEVIHPEDRARVEQLVGGTIDPGSTGAYEVEFRIRWPDASVHWVISKGRAWFEGDGPRRKAVRLVGTVMDITERKRAEDALRESEMFLRESQFIANLGSYVLDIPTGLWRSSEALDKVLGIGQAYERSLEGWIALVHPDDRAMIADYFKNKVLGQYQTFNKEYRIIRYDDQVERWVHGTGQIELDAQKRPMIMHGMIQDITERKRAEDELHRRDIELRTVTDNAPEVIGRVDRQLRHVFINRAITRVTGKFVEEYLGKTNEELGHPPELCALWSAAYREVFETGQPRNLEFTFRAPAGPMHFSLRAVPEFGRNGTVKSILFVMTDITEQKRTEEQLRRSEQQLRILNEELESRVTERTSELRTVVDKLEKEIAERERLENEILEISEREQDRLGQDLHDGLGQELTGISMLSQLLEAKLQAESHPLAQDSGKIATYIRSAMRSARQLARGFYPVELNRYGLLVALEDLANQTKDRFGISCEMRKEGKEPQVPKSAEIHIYRIVQECISNAIKHGKARHIIIESLGGDGTHTFAVTDDGSGFEKSAGSSGMGVHLMNYRARVIGAKIDVQKPAKGGCRIVCLLDVHNGMPLS